MVNNPVNGMATPRALRGRPGFTSPLTEAYDNMNDKELRRRSWRQLLLDCHSGIRDLVEASWFGSFITILIVINTIILSMDHYEMNTELAEGGWGAGVWSGGGGGGGWVCEA